MAMTRFFVAFFLIVLTNFFEGCSVEARPIRVIDKAPPSSYPNIAPSFFDPDVKSSNLHVGGGSVVWYDLQQMFFRIDTNISVMRASFNISTIQTEDASYLITNGVCRDEQGGFQDLFGWLPQSTYNGEVFVEGRGLCDEWVYHTTEGVLVLDAIGNTPVQLITPEQTVTSQSPGNTTLTFSTSWTPTNFTASNISRLAPPPTCGEMSICPSGPAIDETFYLFHDANDYTLTNTNLADQAGDVAFVCISLLLDQFTYFSWVSQYSIEVNTTFGQYAMCNFGTCVGGADDRIGREATAGLVADGGQCLSNNFTGNWYSFPSYNASLCPGGGLGDNTYNETIGINGTSWSGCGWRVIEKIKTIDGKCLVNHGFRNACIADAGFPWVAATQIWEAAFLYDDESQGGCSPIVNTTLPIEGQWSRGDASFYPTSFSHLQLLLDSRMDQRLMSYLKKSN